MIHFARASNLYLIDGAVNAVLLRRISPLVHTRGDVQRSGVRSCNRGSNAIHPLALIPAYVVNGPLEEAPAPGVKTVVLRTGHPCGSLQGNQAPGHSDMLETMTPEPRSPWARHETRRRCTRGRCSPIDVPSYRMMLTAVLQRVRAASGPLDKHLLGGDAPFRACMPLANDAHHDSRIRGANA